MALAHKRLIGIGAAVLGGTILASWAIGAIPGLIFSSDEEPETKPAVAAPGFNVAVRAAPPEPAPEPQPEPQSYVRQMIGQTAAAARPGPSRAEQWYSKVSGSGPKVWRAEGSETLAMGGGSAAGDCRILQPVRAYAMLVDKSTTDSPGDAMAVLTEDIQGQRQSGEWCLAIPRGSPVMIDVAAAGDYADEHAQATVQAIYLPDGQKVDIGQRARALSGLPGIAGEADHHVASKTMASFVGIGARSFNNITRFGQVNIQTGTATDPIEDALRKKLERPTEIKLTRTAFSFNIMPVSTAGY